MARAPKPWLWKSRRSWFVTIDGIRHRLADDKEEAETKFHKMMADPARRKIRGDSLLSIFDLFLEWTRQHRSTGSYRWYKRYLQAFIATVPVSLSVDHLKPFHVQRWIDADPDRSNSTKRGKTLAVKRAVNWARQMGYADGNPLLGLQKPEAGRREKVISTEEYAGILAKCPDEPFQQLLTVAWETGARPQELTAVEARHVDLAHPRWVFPRQEAKGKRKPRIVYLTAAAEAITRELIQRFPTGPLFRNTDGTPWNKSAINSRFCRLQTKLKTKYCLYHFRHSFATRMLQQGRDALTVAELLGHADPSMLAKVYQHLAHDPQHMLQQLRRSVS